MDLGDIAFLLAAGLIAGMVNAVAGGGSLVSFPALLAAGLPPVAANVTNSVAVTPGYLASVVGSRSELAAQRMRIWHVLVTATLGAIVGSVLLLVSPPRAFEVIVPFLVLGSTALLALQVPLRRVVGHPRRMSPVRAKVSLYVVVALAGLYGGYFRPALGVVLFALLALVIDDSLPRLNALKNVGQAVIGVVTVLIFAVFGPVQWLAVAVLVPTVIIGGYLGARVVPRMPTIVWQVLIIAFGTIIGLVLLHQAFS
jgi:uncharacterized protein